MNVNIEDYVLKKESIVNNIDISIVGIDFYNKWARFRVILNSDFDIDFSTRYIDICGDEYEAWGNNDEYIIDLILNKLNLVKKQ